MESKDIINATLDFLKFKVDNNTCTPDELKNISDILTRELDSIGTVEEIAKFFDVPEVNLRTMISRKVSSKPKRKVYYRFTDILKNVPDSWLKKK